MHPNRKPTTFISAVLRFFTFALVGCTLYLGYRQVNRSLYASDADYLNPASWLDTWVAQVAVMVVFGCLIAGRMWIDTRPAKPLIPSRAGEDEHIRRRRDSKRFNERIKLASSALNTAGTSSLVAGFVVPNLNAGQASSHSAVLGVLIAVVCYVCAQLVIGLWKSEE